MLYNININSTLAELQLFAENIDVLETVDTLNSIFLNNKNLPGVIVTKQSEYYLFLSRSKFLEVMSRQYSFELFSKRNINYLITEIKIAEYLILECNTKITQASELALERQINLRFKPIVVFFEKENSYKILDFNELLLANNYIHTLTLNLLTDANVEINLQQTELLNKNILIETQNKKFQSSVTYAKTIQQAILPSQEDISIFFDCFIFYLPRDIVSGDFYWFSSKKVGKEKEKLFFVLADCTGHGVPAAFITIIGSKLLDEIIFGRKEHNPTKILDILNKELIETLNQQTTFNNDGMDMAICLFEKGENETTNLTYAGAKIDLFVAKKNNDIEVISSVRKTLGGRTTNRNNLQFANQKINLKKDDIIYFATDGFADQCNVERKNYTKKRLLKFLDSIKLFEMNVQKELICNELKTYMQSADQRDDISVVGLKIIK